MTFPGSIYAPPGVYTQTNYEVPTEAPVAGIKLPVLIGTGNEILVQEDLEIVRGSSSQIDQQIVDEDEDGRAVVSISPSTGQITLGDFNGSRNRIQVRNFPIVSGDGSGTTTDNPANVVATINNDPIVVLAVDGARGLVTLSTSPQLTDTVRVTYFFNRTDTRITDDVSAQITADPAVIYGEASEPVGGFVLTADNNVFEVKVDGTDYAVNLGTGAKTAATIVTLIQTQTSGSSLVPSVFTNNFGGTAIRLLADRSIEILDGSSNSLIGFSEGDVTDRNMVFYTFQGPIVDGSNGGITTTDPSDVVVRVNNIQVVPSAVNGTTRAVTLPYAPAIGSTVTIQYYFNTYQDTFDYLANINVTEVVRAGIVPGDATYTEEVDFILKDDRIVWGTASLTTAGDHTDGSTFFNDTQITVSLVDVKAFMEVATAVVDQTVSPPLESRTEFDLPYVPTTGNGRSTPLSQTLFNSVSNGRVDLPTFRPDLIDAYWGYSVEDAQNRGTVDVLKVDGSRIILASPVPVGATVYASFYYNTIQDAEFTIACEVSGGSGTGRYSITDSDGNNVLIAQFGTKSAGLSVIPIQFISGSELKPDVRFEGGIQLEETVTVTFEDTDSTLAKFTVLGSDPYYTIQDASDHARLTIDSTTLAGGAAGIDLSRVNGVDGLGFPAHHIGEEIVYDDDTGSTTYAISAGVDDEVAVTVDGILITGTADANATATADDYVFALNVAARLTAANGPTYTAGTQFLGTTVITAGEYDALAFQYTGDSSGPSGTLTATITPGTYTSPVALATAVQSAIATAAAGITGLSVAVTADADGQLAFQLQSAATADEFIQATGSITVTGAPAPSAGDTITIGGVVLTAVNGARTPGNDDFDISSGVAGTIAADIDAAINDPLNSFTTVVTSSVLAAVVTVTAVPLGTLGNAITLATSNVPAFTLSGATLTGGLDFEGGYLEFLDGASAAVDFAILAGISTDTAGGSQVKLLQTAIARRFTVAGGSGRLIYDRVLLRGRFVPGSGSIAPYASEAQAGIIVEGSNGASQAGLVPQATGVAGTRATVTPANILASIPVSANQIATGTYSDARDGQTYVTFYAAGGTNAQNNIFRTTVDGVAVSVEFTDAAGAAIPTGGSADVPLGPAGTANTILAQIRAAFTAAGLSANQALQEGSGIRIVSGTSGVGSSVVVGDGNANSDLGFSTGASSTRTPVEAGKIASALMAHHAATLGAYYLDFPNPAATYFATLALAGVETDDTGAEFLFIQSQAGTGGGLGTSSNITWVAPSTGNGSILLQGTGLLTEHGEGAAGEEGISGLYVTSTDPDGSGSADTSVLNNGTGQDGNVGKTYRDAVTGLTFTVLQRLGGGNYPTGESFTFLVRKVITTDANIPVNAIAGTEMSVSNTLGVPVGDTAMVETFRKEGSEPNIGDIYYATYNYQKTDYTTQFFTRSSAIEDAFGLATPQNPLSLAGFLAKQNGALLVGCKQVLKDEGSDQASVTKYTEAVEELEGFFPGGTSPDILTPLPVGISVTDLKTLLVQMGQHADIQSSLRYRAERTVISGMGSGFQPANAQDVAQTVNRARVRVLYPDIIFITLTDAIGNEQQTVVDGYFMAAAFVGVMTSTDVDVATPWTKRRIIGFDRLGRNLSEIEKNQIAATGVTIVNERPSYLEIRHGYTTEIANILTRTPTIMTIRDEVQQRSRSALDRYIGQKFIAGILNQVKITLSGTLNNMIEEQILSAKNGVQAQVDPSNPTSAEVQAFYRPVWPLLYLKLVFGLRSSSV